MENINFITNLIAQIDSNKKSKKNLGELKYNELLKK